MKGTNIKISATALAVYSMQLHYSVRKSTAVQPASKVPVVVAEAALGCVQQTKISAASRTCKQTMIDGPDIFHSSMLHDKNVAR
jgi:hypothetical protein